MSVRDQALEEAAALCEATAALYLAYSGQAHRRSAEEREAFQRDWQTCIDLARRILALKADPTSRT